MRWCTEVADGTCGRSGKKLQLCGNLEDPRHESDTLLPVQELTNGTYCRAIGKDVEIGNLIHSFSAGAGAGTKH